EEKSEEQHAGGGPRPRDRHRVDLEKGALRDRVIGTPDEGAGNGGEVAGARIGAVAPHRARDRAGVVAGWCCTSGSAFSMSNWGSFFWSWQVAHTPWMMHNEHWSVMP